ncbi:MAG TPA: acetate--CoA ligase family protein, partial [Candidatus Limnocylindria bacterium]|nr:acetate--CoA ligase family protein [Candidatus Limnocylindria bacterium]
QLLTAFRGRPAADIEAIAKTLCLIGDIASEWREAIAEIEIKPLFVLAEGSGVIVGDALSVLK